MLERVSKSARGGSTLSGLATPSKGASFSTGLRPAPAIVEQVVRMTSQNTTRQRRPGRLPFGKSRNSIAGAANSTGMNIKVESQALVSPPEKRPGSVKSV